MKKLHFFLLILLAGFSSCIAPVQGTYESARMLKKGQVKLQGSASIYAEDLQANNYNYGAKVGIGITPKFSLYGRYESLHLSANVLNSPYARNTPPAYNYFELEGKFSILRNKLAFGLPLTFYSPKSDFEEHIMLIHPRLYWTIPLDKNVEFSLIPNVHISTDNFSSYFNDWSASWGLSAGVDFSSNFDKWSIRPEIGYNGIFNAGIGFSINLDGKNK